MDFSNLESLYSFLERVAIPEVLGTTVAEVCEEVAENHTQTDVYDAYTPSQYDRTFELMKSWQATLISNNMLELINIRSDGSRYIPGIIEKGVGYWTPALDSLIGARPFVENTYIELSSGVVAEAMRKGLTGILGAGVVTVT